jgi:lysophospholipase L1-like esterase
MLAHRRREVAGDTRAVKIAFLGDSLTQGWPGAAFFPLLERRLPQHLLLNRGRAGDTVADLRARLQYEGLEPVDAAFIWVGANDAVIGAWDASASGSGWSWDERLARLRGDYEELLEWTAARAPRLVLVQPIILEAEGSLWEARAAEIGGAARELAAARSACRVLDLGPAFAAARAAGAGPFTTDGVHFTDAGAGVVAGAFAAVIAELDPDCEDTPPYDARPGGAPDPRRTDQEARS